MLQRKSGIRNDTGATATTKPISLSRFAFRPDRTTNKRKLVQVTDSSDDEERVDFDWEKAEADRIQEAAMGEFVSGDSDESSEQEEDEETDEEERRRERERSLLGAVSHFVG